MTSQRGAGFRRRPAILSNLIAALLLAVTVCRAAPDNSTQLTLRQFCDLVREHSSAATPGSGKKNFPAVPVDLSAAREVFGRLLKAQGGEAAARQSVDRLSGWRKAAEARLAAQSAAALDVDMLRFDEAGMNAAADSYEADSTAAAKEANTLLGRPADSPLIAVMEAGSSTDADPPLPSPSAPSAKPGADQSAGGQAAAKPSGASPDAGTPAGKERLREQYEKTLLPQGRDLLAKMYQNYLFGGIPLNALLWQEREVFKTDLQFRLLLAGEELKAAPETKP